MKLGEHFLCGKVFSEHHNEYEARFQVPEKDLPICHSPILFKNKNDSYCFAINGDRTINNSYYVGTDWLLEEEKAVYVQPKVNRYSEKQVNYLAMLFETLKHADIFEYTKDLYEIKWDKPEIKINQQQDLLTPLLILQYLQVVKSIVRRGLKKSYYKVEQNLRSRVKGKILVSQNIKQNLAKSKNLNTICSFEEFGFNGIENRILKKALVFVERYLPTHKNLDSKDFFTHTFNYITPAFEQVSAEASIRDCQHIKVNPFFKEYKLAIKLAKQILRRFGYNIQKASVGQVSTPPFWIDMSKLFELYVLGLLKDKYKSTGTIEYHDRSSSGNEIDFLINTSEFKMVIDAKYKLKYQSGQVNHEDIRQVSGYARLRHVYDKLGKTPGENAPYPLIDCLIIYPEEEPLPEGKKESIDLNEKELIKDYVSTFKYGVKLPALSEF